MTNKKWTILTVLTLSIALVLPAMAQEQLSALGVTEMAAPTKKKYYWWQHRGDFEWGGGFRIGEPIGATIRKYVPNGVIDVVVGIPALLYVDEHPGSAKAQYTRSPAGMIMLSYAYRGEIAHNDHVHWSLGAGPFANFKYVYGDHDNDKKTVPLRKEEAQTTTFFGGALLLGMDYVFPGTHTSMFIDLNPGVEYNDKLGIGFVPWAGAGMRFLM